MTRIRTILTLAAILAAALLTAVSAKADSVYLNDGSVLEGTITREGDTFIYITTLIGDIEKNQLVLKTNIKRIVRETEIDEAAADTSSTTATMATGRGTTSRLTSPTARRASRSCAWAGSRRTPSAPTSTRTRSSDPSRPSRARRTCS